MWTARIRRRSKASLMWRRYTLDVARQNRRRGVDVISDVADRPFSGNQETKRFEMFE